MRKMKDSGIERIGKIPEGRETWRIKHAVCTKVTDGPHTTPHLLSEGVPFVSAEAIKNNRILLNYMRGYISKEDHEEYCRKCKPQIYDIFIVKSGATTGAIGMVDFDTEFSIWSPLALIRSDSTRFSQKFIYYSLQSDSFSKQIELFWNYGTQQNIGMNVIENLLFVAPQKELQQQIADYLDKKCAEIDLVIKAKETTNEKLKEYRQSIIYEAVTKGLGKNVPMKDSGIEWIGEIPEGWEVKKLKYIGESIIGITYSPDDICDEGLLVLRSSNVQNGKISYEDNVYVSKEVTEKMLVKLNDILICSRNGSKELIGKCALIDKESENSTFGAFMTVFRSEANRYIYYIFNSPIFNYHIGTFLTTTVNQLTIGNLNNFVIPIPKSETEQQQIADFLDQKCLQIDSVISANEKTIEKLKEYRLSVIYEAVTGKMEI